MHGARSNSGWHLRGQDVCIMCVMSVLHKCLSCGIDTLDAGFLPRKQSGIRFSEEVPGLKHYKTHRCMHVWQQAAECTSCLSFTHTHTDKFPLDKQTGKTSASPCCQRQKKGVIYLCNEQHMSVLSLEMFFLWRQRQKKSFDCVDSLMLQCGKAGPLRCFWQQATPSWCLQTWSSHISRWNFSLVFRVWAYQMTPLPPISLN